MHPSARPVDRPKASKTWSKKLESKLESKVVALPNEPVSSRVPKAEGGSTTSARTTVPLRTTDRRVAGNPSAPRVSRWSAASSAPPSAEAPSAAAPQTVGSTNFLAAQFPDDSAYIPPDAMVAAGPTQLLVATNGRIRTFTKAGVADGAINLTLDSFFGAPVADPRARFDRFSQRWFVTAITVPDSGANELVLAASLGTTLTNATAWNFVSFGSDYAPGAFIDFDTLGVDKQALYIGANLFSGATFIDSDAWVIDKARLIAGDLSGYELGGLIDFENGVGPVSPVGVDNFDATSNAAYFVGVDGFVASQLDVLRINDPLGSPTAEGFLVTVPTTEQPRPVPQPGTDVALDGIDDRLSNALVRNGRLWTSHNLEVNNSGVSGAGDRVGVRWYELKNLTTTPALAQSGTIFDNASTSPMNYWVPSVAVSGQGHAAFGFTRGGSEATQGFASVASAGRLATDALGSTGAPVVATQSSSTYNPSGPVAVERWGDFSHTTVDPTDDMTMWTAQEYVSAPDKWGVRVVQLVAPPPTISSVSSVPVGASSVPVTVDGDGFFEPGAAFAKHLTVTFTGGTSVNRIVSVSPTKLVLDVNTTGASIGAATVKVRNPDGQESTGPSTVTAAASCLNACWDFNGDGKADILWRNVRDGRTVAWFLNGPQYLNSAPIATAALVWVPVASADLNGDGHADIILHNRKDGRVYVWFLKGTTYISGKTIAKAALDWTPVSAADYNGDSKPDILLHNRRDGRVYVWFLNGAAYVSGKTIAKAALDWTPVASADLNGDSKQDVLLHNRRDGRVYVWFLNGSTYVSGKSIAKAALDWTPVASADFNGDSKPDVLLHNKKDGRVYLWFLNGATLVRGSSLGGVTKASLSWRPV